jgi:hypothetical protein
VHYQLEQISINSGKRMITKAILPLPISPTHAYLKSRGNWRNVLGCMLTTVGIAAIASSASAGVIQLITPEQASLKPTGEIPPPLVSKGPAPAIQIVLPETNVIEKTPFHVKILFIQLPDSAIDPKSLKLNLLVGGFVPFSLLDKVKGFVTQKGLDVPQANVPPGGPYTIEAHIADLKGRTGTFRQSWTVK